MFFTYNSAVREMRRNNKSGMNSTIKKMWYGWIVVESSVQRVIDKKL